MKKIFITGGSGTVGSNFIEFNLTNYKIYSYSRNEKSQVALKRNFPQVEIILGSVEDKINLNVESNPEILIDDSFVDKAKLEYKISKKQLNILLGIGGSGQTKRIPFEIFLKFMRLVSAKHDCKFFFSNWKKQGRTNYFK